MTWGDEEFMNTFRDTKENWERRRDTVIGIYAVMVAVEVVGHVARWFIG